MYFGSRDVNVWFPSTLPEAGLLHFHFPSILPEAQVLLKRWLAEKAADTESLNLWGRIGVEICSFFSLKAKTF